MTTVARYMTPAPHTIGRSASLARAHELMRTNDIRHLPVVDAGRLVGIVSQGDLHLLETLADFPLESVDVAEAMTSPPYVVEPDAPLDQVADTMAKHKYGCAVIRNRDGVVAGVFTTVDALRALAELAAAP